MHGAHRHFADAEVHVSAVVAELVFRVGLAVAIDAAGLLGEGCGAEVSCAVEGEAGLGGRGQVCRSAHEPGDCFGQRIQNLARSIAPGHAFGVGRERRNLLVPSIGKLALLHLVEVIRFGGILGFVLFKLSHPAIAKVSSALADALLEMFVNAIGHVKFFVGREAVILLRPFDFLVAQRLAMRGMGVLLGGSAPADMAVHDNQRRPVPRVAKHLKRALKHLKIIGVADAGDIPSISDEASSDVFAEMPDKFRLQW